MFQLLLDQGFPKPTAFAVEQLDQTAHVVHFSDFAPHLSQNSTPDWYLYCIAAEARFDALVVRDRSQLEQLAEMYVLSRLKELTIVTWQKGIDDPVREWGQLLAYLPHVRQRCREAGGRVIQLPSPSLTKKSFHDPRATIADEADKLGIAVGEARHQARAEISDWLTMNSESADRFDEILRHQ